MNDKRLVFDGRGFASRIEADLSHDKGLVGKKLLILTSDSESVYVGLKQKMGEKLGVVVDVVKVVSVEEVKKVIEADGREADGILVQLPVGGLTKEETLEVCRSIPVDKDVDGLNPNSGIIPAAVKAVMKIIEADDEYGFENVAVVGARGNVGSRLVEELRNWGIQIGEFDLGDDLRKLKNFDGIISATGVADLIKPEMVRKGFVGIDLGFPKGDISREAGEKAGMITPVPGGVGPVTIVCLFENLAML